jgi:hypothetical protein
MNDIRLEITGSTMFNVRRATNVIRGLGKGYYPEALLGIHFK